MIISKFVFQSKNWYQKLDFVVKIQNSILRQKSKFTIFLIFILILNWKSKDTFRTHRNPHSFFIFIKKWRTKYSSFSNFHFHEEIKKELLKKVKAIFMVTFISMVYTLFTSKFMSNPLKFSPVQWSRGHQESAV